MVDLTIKDVRSKFPEYDDLGDQELADAIHGKHYSDMPKPDFYAKIGFSGDAVPQEVIPPQPGTPPRVAPGQPAPPPMVPPQIPSADLAGALAPLASARPEVPPVPVDVTDDARAKRGFGRSAYLDGLINVPDIPGGNSAPIASPPTLLDAMAPPVDPFEGEGFGPLAKRRGQQFARGATEVAASIPEAMAILSRDIVRNRYPSVAEALPALQAEQAKLTDILSTSQPGSPEATAARMRLTNVEGQILRAARMVQEDEASLADPLQDDPRFKAGDQIRDASADTFGAPDPRDTSFWGKVAEGGGNMTALAASAFLGPAGLPAGAGMGSAMNSSQMYKEAIAAGASEDDAMIAARWGSAIGASEIIPINRALKLLPPRLRDKVGKGFYKRLSDIAQGSGEEAAQEYLATVANNIVAQQIYDPERGWTEGATEAALVGAVLGGGMGAVGTAFDRDQGDAVRTPRRGSEEEPVETAPAAPVAPSPLPEQAISTPKPEVPAQPPASPDTLEAAMMPDQPPQEPAPAPQPQTPPVPQEGNFEIMDETETVDGETRLTGRKVRVNLDTGQVSPLDPDVSDTTSPDQSSAVQDQPQAPSVVGADAQPAAGARPDPETAPDPVSTIRTATLTSEEVGNVGTDAKTFQYKGESDQDGVTDRLRGVENWDERSAMGGIIYEYADGRRVVADGHQRLGLAKGLQAKGKKTPWNVEIIREEDGFAPADVRRIAALKNIREGSGTSIDAAKVLREAPDEVDSLNLPPKSALVRDAKGLARLSDDAFGMIINEVVKPEWGAVVGQSVQDQTAHADIITLLKKLQPRNNEQAAMIARQAAEQTVTETQTSLFGDEEISQNLYLERAKVLDSAIKRLKKDKATFKVLSDRADTIAQAGNVLDADANAQRVEDDSKAQAYLEAEANRKGRISDALTAAAKVFKDNPRSAGRIVGDFLKAIREPEPDQGGSDRASADEAAGSGAQPEVDPPQTEQTDAGQQSLIPGVEPVSDRDRAEAEMSKPKTGGDEGAGSGRDDLFGDPEDRKDLFDAPQAEATTAGTYVDRRPAGTFDDGLHRTRVDELPDQMDPDNLGEESMRLVVEKGKERGVEHLIMIDADGQIIAYGSGSATGTGVPAAMRLLFDGKESIVAHHNHPSSAGFSPADYALTLSPGMKTLYAHGHDGSTYRMSPTALGVSMWRDNKNDAARTQEIKRDIDRVLDNMWRNGQDAIRRLINSGVYPLENTPGQYAMPGIDRGIALAKAMQEAGLIEYSVTGPAAARHAEDANPFLFDPELRKLYDNLVRALKRRARDADTEGNYDRPTDARGHPGDLAGASQGDESGQGQNAPEQRTGDGDVRDGDRERQARDQGEDASGVDADDLIQGKEQRQPAKALDIMYSAGHLKREAATEALPKIRSELDRMNLHRVGVALDQGGRDRQGAFIASPFGAMDILIGQSLDTAKTLYHEAIHAMRHLNLFTPKEWVALEHAAEREWINKYDIEGRYPDLLRSEQIEEAIAEAFSDNASKKKPPSKGALITAMNKIARILRAIRNAFGKVTPKDVFEAAFAGEIGARTAENTGFTSNVEKAQAQPAPRGPGPLIGAPHIPDRGVWDELTAANAGIFERLGGAKGAISDAVDRARVRVQDRFLPVLRAQQAIEQATSQKLGDEYDAYVIEETFSGKAGQHLDRIEQDFTRHIVDIISDQKDLTSEMVGDWLTARHAKERNAHIASINKNMPDGGSGMTNAEAERILADMDSSQHKEALHQIGDLIGKMRDRTLALRVDAGLITKEDADVLRKMYKHYVPLKGFAETDNSEASLDRSGIGSKYSVKGPEDKRALGRKSRSFNPLTAAIVQAQEVAIRAEKNRVAQSVYRLAKDYPSENLWTIKPSKEKRFFNATTGMVETRSEAPIASMLETNEMAVKVDGKEYRVTFHDDRITKALGQVGADSLHPAIAALSVFNRFLSTMITTLDPEFVIRNAFRDVTAASINVGSHGTDAKKIRRGMLKNWPKAFAAAYQGQKGKVDSQWQKHYREFVEAGAKVHFFTLENPEAGAKDFDRRLKLSRGPMALRALKVATSPRALVSSRDNAVLGFVERTNLAVDNAVRLAAFVEARKMGWSKQKAASLSKNLTVNFNRRGSETGWLNAMFLFFNAAVQGLHVTAKAMASKKGMKVMGAMVLYGVLKDQINAAISEEDEDGELAYDKIPDYKTGMNDIWMVGDTAVTIPMPYIYALFPYIGQQISKKMRGVKDTPDLAGDIFAASLQQTSPIQVSEGFRAFIPTAMVPAFELATNEDWLGRNIRPEQAYGDYGPDAYKYYQSVTETSKIIADLLNRGTGGTIGEPGLVDVSPEYIDHVAGFLTGGAGKFVGRSTDIAIKLTTGDEIERRNTPFARTLTFETGDFLDRDRYYRFRQEVKEAAEAADLYREAGQKVPDHIMKLMRLERPLREHEKILRAQRKGLRALDDNRNLPRSEKIARRERILKQQANQFIAFNKRYISLMGSQSE